MKKTYALLLLVVTTWSCNVNKNETPSKYTGKSETYTLYQASDFSIEGFVTFNELKTGFTEVNVKITPTSKGLLHPVHIHHKSIEEDGEMAVSLNPVNGETGKSDTELTELADGTSITYQQLIEANAAVKIHFSATPPDYFTILVGGNIGTAQSKENPYSRRIISVCK